MSGGSGAQGETRYNWNDDMAPRWNSLLNTAPWAGGFQMDPNTGNVIGIKPRETYAGTRFAPLTGDQNESIDYTRNMARMSTSPIGSMNAARSQIEGTLGGDYLTGPNSNPYARTATGNPYITGNQYMDQNTSTNRNMFAGDNPYFRNMAQQGAEDITSAYNQGTAADTKGLFALSGAFGGSAHQQALANNEAALGKTLNNYYDSMLNQQYNRSAGLEDQFLSRDIQNQQYNKGSAVGMREAELGRGFQDYGGMLDRGYNSYEAERNRQMQATGLGQNEQGLAYDRINALMGSGQMQQGQNQQMLDFLYDQWNQQQNHPYQTMNWLSGLYGNAMGGGGMNTSVYGPSGSSWGPALGGLLAGASMFG